MFGRKGERTHVRRDENAELPPMARSHLLSLSGSVVPNLFLLANPQTGKRKLAYPLEKAIYGSFIKNLSVNLKLLKIWRTSRDLSCTTGGSRTPGWEPLVWIIANKSRIIDALKAPILLCTSTL